MLPEEKYKELLYELDNCKNPLFIFDDDPDGLCSFLLLYRYKKEGRWCYVKTLPKVTKDYVKYIDSQTDKIFILDMPEIDEDFFDEVKIPIIWVDHHPHGHPQHVKSFNPHDFNYKKKDTSTTALCYNAVKQDLWLAAVGAIADWTMPVYIKEFKKTYPDLLDKEIKEAPEALFNSKLSEIIEIFSMVLKGNSKTTKQSLSTLRKINSPYELLLNESSESKLIRKKVNPIINEYKEILNLALNNVPKDKIFIFIYSEKYNSFSSEIANFLQFKFPNKVIIVGRLKNGEYKLSIRSQNTNINLILERILSGLNGSGGGHDNACGVCINENHFEEFIYRFKKEI
ncbi:MAG: DHH family phosphoesterase [Candidatus Woesearchaeota archaeon]